MLNVRAFALTCGIFWAASLMLIAVLTMKTGLGLSFVNMVSEVYLGYGSTLVGALLGAVWGFLDGLVCGAIFAWLYNKIAG
ncbi:MAG: bacteriophage holin [Candidatus Peribacteraceae bacterium]|nr:bacteriophage holin [Candidatus Peribacteraceae bacterium]MDD5739633.1 bacteriophage holin [Candidatus Peribacteraceae bacterium]